MSLHDSTSVTYNSSSMALQYSSEETEKKICPKLPGRRQPDPLEIHLAKECENENLDNEIREKYQEIVIQRQKLKEKTQAVDYAIIKAFAMCRLLFSITENSWFIDILKYLRFSYTLPICEYLANTLLSEEVIKVNWKTEEYLKTANNLTLGLDEFLYSFHDLSHVSHTADLLFDEIEKILIKIGPEKFIEIISDNASAIFAARRQINQKYPFIFNFRCIVHFVNLISQNILKCGLPARILKYCNKLYRCFKASYLAKSYLKKYIEKFNIHGGELKIFIETR
ncbi:zinc finger bed domain-containing protein 1-like [Gigaspora margarita]|uniref:Zinc finger bed domain-containing protein 1-like n=1 Tax=Gigaspora margarita TaxID=4874 RepID=A0A8H3XHH9_GIGMA|nr:zinc finger bed domain-containing protein 1-like [Gigaspora margarita]